MTDTHSQTSHKDRRRGNDKDDYELELEDRRLHNNNNNNNISEMNSNRSHMEDHNNNDDNGDGDDGDEVYVQTLDIQNLERISEGRRFVQMSIACFAMLCGSASFAFNIYSGALQSTYKYNFRDMSSINTVGMVFCYFLVPYGMLFDYFGPRPVYTLACLLFSLGALLMGLTFHEVINASPVRFAVYNVFLSLGSQLFDLATVVTMLLIFPTKKGWVVALLKTLMGLGQALLATINSGFFSTHPPYFFYFLMGLVLAVSIAVQIFIRLPSYHLTGWEQRRLTDAQKARRGKSRAAYLTQVPPMWRFWLGLIVIFVLIVYLPLTSALAAFLDLPEKDRQTFAIVAIIIFCLILLMMAPFRFLDRLYYAREARRKLEEEGDAEERGSHSNDAPGDGKEYDEHDFMNLKEDTNHIAEGDVVEPIGDGLETPMDSHNNHTHNNPKNPNNNSAAPRKAVALTDVDFIAPQYQTSFWRNLGTITLWAIVWTFFCGVGSEFVVIFNARFVYGALDGKPTDNTINTLLTVINGVGSAIGRLAMSYFEVLTVQRKVEDRIPITFSFFVPTTCIIVSIILFLVLPGKALLAAFALTALGNGFCASVTILVIQTIYAKDCAKHYNFGYSSLWIAAILLNRLLFGEWFATQADKQQHADKLCYGKSCVLMPMLVMLGLNVTAFLSDIYLHVRYCRYSRRVLAERRRVREEALLSEPTNQKAVFNGMNDEEEDHHRNDDNNNETDDINAKRESDDATAFKN